RVDWALVARGESGDAEHQREHSRGAWIAQAGHPHDGRSGLALCEKSAEPRADARHNRIGRPQAPPVQRQLLRDVVENGGHSEHNLDLLYPTGMLFGIANAKCGKFLEHLCAEPWMTHDLVDICEIFCTLHSICSRAR